jgi:hypothetical protein
MLAATGAITEPHYYDTTSGEQAFERHVMGALVVEIDGDKFHVRQLQFAEDGSFWDFADGLCLRYSADGITKGTARLIGRGDDHGGPSVWGDPTANEAAAKLTTELQPDMVTVEDMFDGASVNPHAVKSISQRLGTPRAATTIASEGEVTRLHLQSIRALLKKGAQLVVKPSNHHRFLNRYLDDGRWPLDSVNYSPLVLTLARLYHFDGVDPVQALVDPDQSIARWLRRDDSFVVEGVEYGFHLDEGNNGGPASNRAHAASHGKAGGGHVHSPQILWGIFRSGTMARKRQGYNSGPSSWEHSLEVCWPGGMRQLVHIIDGSYRL